MMLKSLYSFIFLVALCLTPTYGQKLTRDDNTGFYKLDTIVNSTQNKNVLFENAVNWLNTNFKGNTIYSIEQDKNSGEIIFKGSDSRHIVEEIKQRKNKISKNIISFSFYFNGKIIVKENKYRLIFNNIESSTYLGIKHPILQNSIDEGDLIDVYIFDELKMYQKSLIRALDMKPDSDF